MKKKIICTALATTMLLSTTASATTEPWWLGKYRVTFDNELGIVGNVTLTFASDGGSFIRPITKRYGESTLALANMIMRKDGKSHILHGDCFDKNTIKKFKNLKDTKGDDIVLNKGLLNPPYSQKDHAELEFLEQELSLICQGGEVAVVCPMSCAIGTKFKEVRERLMGKHTLKAVFSMPDDIFYGQGAGTCVCVMVWEAKKKHDSKVSTFFGYYKDDGFVKRKKLGRVDAYERWEAIKSEWLRLYREKEVVDGLTAKACVSHNNEWLCEAYMKTDYTKLTREDFQTTLNDYLTYLVKEGNVYESND